MTLRRVSLSPFMFLCFHVLLYTTSEAALSSSILQAINCSTSSNYSATSAYAANVNQFLMALPENAVTKNGGFYNGTIGEGPDTAYGLAMCPADYSRADCGDCLAASAGLPSRCPGSTTVLALFERCLIRYSNVDFFGTPEIGVVLSLSGERVSAPGVYSQVVAQALKGKTDDAMISPQRFAASAGHPYVFVQCTWDLSADKCKQCLDFLSDNASGLIAIRTEGERKSYSCTIRYSNTSFMVVPFTAASTPTPQSIDQQTGTSAPSWASSGSRAAIVAGVVVAVVAGVVASVWYVLKRRQRMTLPETQDNQVGVSNTGFIVHDGRFTYEQLERATNNFSDDENKLGEGAFGAVYKGTLEIENVRKHVAIKRIMNTTSSRVRADFANEIKVMRRVNHRNIIHLVGSCDEDDKLLLVYELMNNGNLEEMLYPEAATIDADIYHATELGTTLQLDWPNRQNILIGMASALEYLHTLCSERVLHRDIKPSNVMLDRNFNAKLCDFGLVSQGRHTQSSRLTNTVCGTFAYMDPHYMNNGRLSEQSDVYSFGVVLLEVVCGMRPSLQNNKNTLVEKVRECHGRNAILEAADTRLTGPEVNQRIKRLLMIGLLCVQPEPRARPPIINVKVYLRAKTTEPLPALSGNQTVYTTCSDAPLARRDEESGEAALLPSEIDH